MLRKGEWVWVDSDIGVPIGAKVKVTPSGQRLLINDEGEEQSLSPELEASLKIMHPTSVEGVEDMIKLGDMNEAGLLRNLQLRHKQGKIYTYTGSVLVAVNPYQNYPIYTDEQVKMYKGRKLGELPPHIFGIAEACYSNMKRRLRSQCCIISGESGAGKTESTKLILQYLAAVSGELSEQQIEQQILESNPLLEAFGNAKTVRNDNSSRFGKYLEIFFSKDGVVEGARVEQYLLEKSRVCHQALDERNYHVFYCLLAGVTEQEKKELSLGKAEEYRFLSKGGCIVCDGRDDAKDFTRIRSAMKILTFSENETQDIFKLLAAILHLGNICFEASTQDNLETSNVAMSEHFSIAASLLEVHGSSLSKSLTNRSFMANRERVTKPLSSEQASDCRDALVKAIYNKLFVWIAGKVNSVISNGLSDNSKSSLSIGLLDIFGFENFDMNSFEQLCINFANEKLQQFFVSHIFKLEQKEYMKEDIKWKSIQFTDNQDILDLLAEKPCNILALIDEESHFPKGTDTTLLNKMNQQHSENQAYIPSKNQFDSDFGICHFAGKVYYDSNGFLEKTRDAGSSDILKMIEMSKNNLLHQIFNLEPRSNGLKVGNNNNIFFTPRSSPGAKAEGKKQVPTLSAQFRQSLDSLMRALSNCQPFFIRCFKPNNDKQSDVFDRELCMRQLRYSGMMDTIRIRKLGYPIRHTFQEFLNRYRVLLKSTPCDPKTKPPPACCEAICRIVIKGHNEWIIGKTKVFLKDSHDVVLEQLREQELNKTAMIIHRVMMGHKDRKLFVQKRRAVLLLQKNWRAYKDRCESAKSQHGFDRLKAKIRGRKLRFYFQKKQEAALKIQSQFRGYRERKKLKKKRQAAIVLQAHARGMLVRKKTQRTKEEDTAETEMDDIALELQQRLLDIAIQQGEDEHKQDSEDDSESNIDGIIVAPPPEEAKEESEGEMEGPPVITFSPASNSSTHEEENEFDDDSDKDSFYKFSIQHFQGEATHKHITSRIRQPLLSQSDEGDALACVTVFWIILRYMEDMAEPKKSQDAVSQASSTISSNLPLPNRRGRRLSSLVGLDQKILRKLSIGRKTSTIFEEQEDLTDDEDVMIGEGPKLHRYLTSQEKLQIIIGYALSRKNIRDEIYCQICKQLVDNRNSRSQTLGWSLMSICLGIFPPTDLFMECLEDFVKKGPMGYGVYCSKLLRRIKENGERQELPCSLEIQAAKTKQLFEVPVKVMDGRSITVQLDSAATSAEVCESVAQDTGLRDTYGFSLYISMFDKMWSLGSSKNHVLDAVSQCEQEMRRQGKQEKDAPWSLSFRKELFRPWHDCRRDQTSTDLIYRQIIMGVKSGEYTGDKDDEYIQMAAQHFYIRFGADFKRDNVQKVVEECIATPLIENKSMSKWIQLVSDEHIKGPYVNGEKTSETVKGELVDNARSSWPIYFSKFYDVTVVSGPPLPNSRFIVAVNWTGVFFMDGRDKRLMELPYLEVKAARLTREEHVDPQSVSLSTVRGEFVLSCPEAAEMAALIEENLEGLRKRSEYALMQQDTSKQGNSIYLPCKRGDLLQVEKGEDYPPEDSLVRVTNQRTSNSGVVHIDSLQFLPTLNRPPDDILDLLGKGSKKTTAANGAPQREETVAPASLKEYAQENFRPSGKEAGKQGLNKGGGKEKLWVCTKEPLKQPLLKTLARNSELSTLACNAFTAILKYMGDYPIKQFRSPLELTDQIFGPATQHEALRDEIYCQIMRQMTGNQSRLSMERGWHLMWLCTGLFPPSEGLVRHTQRFLESRPRDQLSPDSQQRLKRMLSKEPRKLPPHMVEVDAIQQDSTQIFHKVHFPNDTDLIVEVSSTTTIKELCNTIVPLLKLSSSEGYGLYLQTQQKFASMEDNRYFFDSLRQTSDAPKKAKKVKEGTPATMPYRVVLRRKLWFNVTPGKDQIADLTFHFPQEQPKYLKGYHDCTKEDMIKLAGLLFRTQVDSDRSQFVMIPKMLKGLVPADQIKTMTPDEWKKHIISSYNKQSGITVDEAKIEFLKVISSWPTFGCAFFEVKQSSDRSYPNPLLIAVNKQGVNFIHPKTKELLMMHQFNKIIEYKTKGNTFQMSLRALLKNVKFTCETPQAETIEDLIRSYFSMYESTRDFSQPRPSTVFF